MDSKKWMKLRDKCPARFEPYGKENHANCMLQSEDYKICQKQKDCPFVYWHEDFNPPQEKCISGGDCYEGKYCQCVGCEVPISTTE